MTNKELLMANPATNETTVPLSNENVQVWEPKAPSPSNSECVIHSQPGFINPTGNSDTFDLPHNNGYSNRTDSKNDTSEEKISNSCCDGRALDGCCQSYSYCCLACCEILTAL